MKLFLMPLSLMLISIMVYQPPSTNETGRDRTQPKNENDLPNASDANPSGAPFSLKDGDRVVFYGDSITEQHLYTDYVEAFTLTRFPKRDLHFVNAGWAGDATWGGGGGSSEERVKRDVKPVKPTVITIMLGMNDGGYVPFDPKIYDVFNEWYGKLLNWMQNAAPNARITLIRTSPYDDVAHEPMVPGGYNAVLLHFGEVVRQMAQTRHLSYVDFNAPLVEALKCAKASDKELAQKFIPDAIHPGPAGGLLMAGELLKSWNAPSIVSAVELDAAAKHVLKSENTAVSGFDGMNWAQKDEALPFAVDPNDPAITLARRCSQFTNELNRQMLTVTGLPTGSYQLTIDGQKAADFSSEQLAQGVNLALLDTPMRRQSLQVLNLTSQRSHIAFLRWREIQVSYGSSAGAKKAAAGLDALESEIRQKQRQAARPLVRHYSLKRLTQF